MASPSFLSSTFIAGIQGLVKVSLKDYTKTVDLKTLELTKDYLFNNSIKEKIYEDSKIINYQAINIPNEQVVEKHASKVIGELISSEVQDTLSYGTMMHEVFENSDFLNLDINDKYYNILFDFTKKLNITDKTKVYKEHEFIYEKDGVNYHGIIDLVLIEEDVIKIVDYKLKNIEDEKYKEQLKVYFNYLKGLFDKDIKLYLYSIMEDRLKEIIN